MPKQQQKKLSLLLRVWQALADPALVSLYTAFRLLSETSGLLEKEHEKVFSSCDADIRLSPVILASLPSAVACDFPGGFVTWGFHRPLESPLEIRVLESSA